MTLKKNSKVLVPKCPCAQCSGDENSHSNCVQEAVGWVHIVKTTKRGMMSMKCGLLARRDEVTEPESVKRVCQNCIRGKVIWNQPQTAGNRHEELLNGIDSLHHLIGGLIAFVTAHAHPNDEDGCKVCEAMKKQFENHQKGCPDCHE